MAINSFRQGEHICALYETEEEQLAIAAEYVIDALRSGARALYVAEDKAALNRFNTVLEYRRVNVSSVVKRGALLELTHDDAHLAEGRFDAERMLRMLNDAVEAALNDGFSGLRTCGDMSWLLKEPAGADQVVAYEAFLNSFFNGVCGAGMCQYDRRRLPTHLIDSALATHSSAVVERAHKPNPFYRPPTIAISRAGRTGDVHWKLNQLRQRT